MHSRKGFTLLELIIVVAIVSILAGISYPMYTEHVQKTRRGDAKAALHDYQSQIERCYIETYNYQTCGNNILSAAVNVPFDGTKTYYSISVASSSASAYRLQATANGVQASDSDCQTFTINQMGAQGATNADGDDSRDTCW